MLSLCWTLTSLVLIPCTLLAATNLAPSRLEARPSLLFFIDSGISLAPCFFTWGASFSPTHTATVLTPFTLSTHTGHLNVYEYTDP